MTDAHRITVKSTVQKTNNIKQHFMSISAKSKQDALLRIIDSEHEFYGLVFCNTKRKLTRWHCHWSIKGIMRMRFTAI